MRQTNDQGSATSSKRSQLDKPNHKVAAGLGAVAETMDRDGEEAHWRMNYSSRPYVAKDASYDDYGPACRYGVSSFGRNLGQSFDHAEADLSRGWNAARGKSTLAWDHAKLATRDAWDRLKSSTWHSQ